MTSDDRKFSVVIPATLEKGEDGEWRVFGLASTSNRDQQGEIIDLKGVDLTPIQKGRGVFNFDHKKGPENTVGIIDTYKKSEDGLYLGGYLFKGHERAKALYQIMTSLNKADRGRMGMSVEGVIKERRGADGKTISKAQIHSCALTMNPVNSDTYINLVKSFSEIEMDSDVLSQEIMPEDKVVEVSSEVKPAGLTFSIDQVAGLLKALSVGSEQATSKPSDLTGGAALAREDMKSGCANVTNGSKMEKCMCKGECNCKKSLKKANSIFFKSTMIDVLDKLHGLYPEVSRAQLWEVFRERLNNRFNPSPENK